MKAIPELLVIPYIDKDTVLSEGEELRMEYPNGKKTAYKGLSGEFSRDAFSERVGNQLEGRRFVYRRNNINFAIELIDASTESSEFCTAIQDIFRILIADFMGEIEEVRFMSGRDSKQIFGAKISNVMDFISLIAEANLDGTIEGYRENSGQIEMARRLRGINLNHLYLMANKFGIAEELGWTKMRVSFEVLEEFEAKLEKDFDGYKGNRGQIKMAEELGGLNLGQLYSLASGLGVAEELEWTVMEVPFEAVAKFEAKLEQDFDGYRGNRGQIKMARELGRKTKNGKDLEGMNLGQLYSLASGLGVAEELGWTRMRVSCEVIAKFEAKLEQDFDGYKGNDGQLKMAKELGEMNLAGLYSLANGLGVAEDLGWTLLNAPYLVAVEFRSKLEQDFYQYESNDGQIKMAEELGGVNVGQVSSLGSGFGVAEKLGWTVIEVPFEVVAKFEAKLEKDFDGYIGNRGQIKMAEELGKIHLGQLYSLASGLGVAEELEWTVMEVPFEAVAKFEAKLEKDFDGYKGNRGQIKMAKEFGGKTKNGKDLEGMNLGQLYSLASGLGVAEKLGWTKMIVPYELIAKFEAKLEQDFDGYKGNRGQIKMARELGKVNLGGLYSLASGLELVERLGWTKMRVSFEVLEEFEAKLEKDFDGYKGNKGQIKMARELGKIHLGGLYSLASGLEMTKDLKWDIMNIPYHRVAEFMLILTGLIEHNNLAKYRDTEGRNKFGEAFKYHLYTLNTLSKFFGLEGILNWVSKTDAFVEAEENAIYEDDFDSIDNRRVELVTNISEGHDVRSNVIELARLSGVQLQIPDTSIKVKVHGIDDVDLSLAG